MKPEIRFKEFTNAWEQHGILSSNRDSGHAESSPYSDFEKNSMPSVWKKVRLGDILKNHSFKKLIVVPVQNGKYVVIQQGNIPIAGYSDLAHFDDYDSVVLFGDHTLSLYKPNKPFALASDGVKIFYSEFTTGNYLYYLLENNLPENEGYKRYSQILKNQEVYIVENKTEQNKISKLFASLDSLVALHQRKCDKLKNVKKSLLEKMFPAEGKDVPEIRFKEFTDAWEQRTYGDIGQCFSGGNLSYDSLSSEGKNKCVLYGELYTTYDCIIKDVVNRTDFVGNTIYKNDILFPQSTTVDADSLISPACLNDERAETSGVFVIRPKENIDGNFVCYYSKGNSKQRAKLAKKAQGLTIVHLYYQSIKDEEIFIPSHVEQEKISKLFSQLDSLVALHQRKCEKLKNIKKALLEKMFC